MEYNNDNVQVLKLTDLVIEIKKRMQQASIPDSVIDRFLESLNVGELIKIFNEQPLANVVNITVKDAIKDDNGKIIMIVDLDENISKCDISLDNETKQYSIVTRISDGKVEDRLRVTKLNFVDDNYIISNDIDDSAVIRRRNKDYRFEEIITNHSILETDYFDYLGVQFKNKSQTKHAEIDALQTKGIANKAYIKYPSVCYRITEREKTRTSPDCIELHIKEYDSENAFYNRTPDYETDQYYILRGVDGTLTDINQSCDPYYEGVGPRTTVEQLAEKMRNDTPEQITIILGNDKDYSLEDIMACYQKQADVPTKMEEAYRSR